MTADRADVPIRPERPDDHHAIRRVNDAAFGGTIEGQIVEDLRGTEDWVDDGSIVAVSADDRVVGHLLVSAARLEAEDGSTRPIWVIGPGAVEPKQQRQGIGTALMNAAIALATERGQPLSSASRRRSPPSEPCHVSVTISVARGIVDTLRGPYSLAQRVRQTVGRRNEREGDPGT